MFKHFADNRGQRYRTIVGGQVFFSLLEDWDDMGIPPVSWNFAGVERKLVQSGKDRC